MSYIVVVVKFESTIYAYIYFLYDAPVITLTYLRSGVGNTYDHSYIEGKLGRWELKAQPQQSC